MDEAVAQLEAHAVTADEEASFNRRITLANEDFHGIIHEACGNQRLRQYLIELQNLFPKDYLWRAISSDLSRWVGIEEHRAIRVALKAHDRVAARRTMSDHVAHSGRLLLAYLDEHSFWQ
jgi:DNA-binding GntR family transcriptional regulator